eukprot:SAG22_NODE_1656_length_3888_cov_3.928477_1_plen_28_part_10
MWTRSSRARLGCRMAIMRWPRGPRLPRA